MKRMKWWHWVLVILVVLAAGDWIISGTNPVTALLNGFHAGFTAAK